MRSNRGNGFVQQAMATVSPRRRLRSALAVLGGLALGPGDAAAQGPDVTRIPDAVSCSACAIRVQPVVTLRPSGDAGFSSLPNAVAVDASGRYWLAEFGELVRICDRDGAMIRRLGTKGRGPNEFMVPIGFARLPGDSMLVFDGGDDRAVIVDAELRSVRMVSLPGSFVPILPLRWPHVVVANGNIRSIESAGLPLHLLSLTDARTEASVSFGYEASRLIPGRGQANAQVLAASANGSFWSADLLRLRFSKWADDGRRLQTFERTPVWFAVASEYWIGNPTTPPPPQVTALHEDADGLIWVYVRVAASRWREAWPAIATGAREVLAKSVQYDRLFRTNIEVIDPKTGKLVTRIEHPRLIFAALDGGRVAEFFSEADGTLVVSIASLSMTRPQ